MKLDTNDGILHFKSLPEYYYLEMRGAKANTLRVVTQDEYDIIMSCMPDTIVITNVDTDVPFEREISSIVRIRPSFGISVDPGKVLILVSWWS